MIILDKFVYRFRSISKLQWVRLSARGGMGSIGIFFGLSFAFFAITTANAETYTLNGDITVESFGGPGCVEAESMPGKKIPFRGAFEVSQQRHAVGYLIGSDIAPRRFSGSIGEPMPELLAVRDLARIAGHFVRIELRADTVTLTIQERTTGLPADACHWKHATYTGAVTARGVKARVDFLDHAAEYQLSNDQHRLARDEPESNERIVTLRSNALRLAEAKKHNLAAEQWAARQVLVDKSYGENHLMSYLNAEAWADQLEDAGAIAQAIRVQNRVLSLVEKLYPFNEARIGQQVVFLARLKQALGLNSEALPLLQRALAISERFNGSEHPSTAARLNGLAIIYLGLADYPMALVYFQRALAIRERVLGSDDPLTAQTLGNIAVVHEQMGQYSLALPISLRALSISEKTRDGGELATADRLNNLAGLYAKMGDLQKALPMHLKALKIRHAQLGTEHASVAESLNNIASILSTLGDFETALSYYEKALEITERTLGLEHRSTGARLNNIASVYLALGRYSDALPLFLRALAISEKTDGIDHPSTAISLGNLGSLYSKMGRFGDALPAFQRALSISEKAEGASHLSTGRNLNNLAGLYKSFGQFDLALSLYHRALAINERSLGAEHPATAVSLGNLGGVYLDLGRANEALPLYERALRITEKVDGQEHPNLGDRLEGLASAYSALARHDDGIRTDLRALALTEKALGSDHPKVGILLNSLAVSYVILKRPEDALPLYLRAYSISVRTGHLASAKTVQSNLAKLYRSQAQQELAIFFGKESVNTIQRLRSNSRELDQGLQRALLSNNSETYNNLAQWLIEAGRLAEAQEVISMLKEDELQGFVQRSGEADPRRTLASFNGPETDWHAQAQQASGLFGTLAQDIDVLKKIPSDKLNEAQKADLAAKLAQVVQLQERFEAILRRIQTQAQAEGAQAGASARAAAASTQNKLRALLGRLGKEGHARPAALQFLVTDEKLLVIVTLPDLQFARETAVSAKALRTQIERFRQVLQTPSQDPRPQAQALYKLLIGPVAADLEKAQVQHLMVSLTDALRYIPFSTLHDGEQYLMQRFQLSMLTEAALGAGMEKPPRAWTISGLGVSDKVSEHFSALPSVGAELEAIVRTNANPQGAMPGDVSLNRDFTASRYRSVIDRQPPVIHLATHFKFAAGAESQSYLLLGDGSRLSLSEMMSERYRFTGLDLLTLSACETALGGGIGQSGREVEGLGAQAQRYGAAAVIATLWQVADNSTFQLMRHFYALRIQRPQLNKSEALRLSQVALLEGKESPVNDEALLQLAKRGAQGSGGASTTSLAPRFPFDASRAYAHPFYWAPFVLMGNWL